MAVSLASALVYLWEHKVLIILKLVLEVFDCINHGEVWHSAVVVAFAWAVEVTSGIILN